MDESDAIPCWVDSGVESIKEEDAIGSDRVQEPCFDLEWDIYPNLTSDEYDLVAPYRTGPHVRLGGTMLQELSSGPMVKMMLTINIYSMYCTQLEEEASHVYIRYPLSTKIEIQS